MECQASTLEVVRSNPGRNILQNMKVVGEPLLAFPRNPAAGEGAQATLAGTIHHSHEHHQGQDKPVRPADRYPGAATFHRTPEQALLGWSGQLLVWRIAGPSYGEEVARVQRGVPKRGLRVGTTAGTSLNRSRRNLILFLLAEAATFSVD